MGNFNKTNCAVFNKKGTYVCIMDSPLIKPRLGVYVRP